ncbi:MAG: hypothetical protein KGO51_14420 [Alphaproteobacteria bacterium]|nr:hypothetical protein [Alphaproteobacteria bacterium]
MSLATRRAIRASEPPIPDPVSPPIPPELPASPDPPDIPLEPPPHGPEDRPPPLDWARNARLSRPA